MNAAHSRLAPIVRAVPTAPPSEPFPERITSGCDRTAAALRAEEQKARARQARHLDRVERDGDPTAARRYRDDARLARAFARLAELHDARQMPSPLFTVKTRRHVQTLLAADAFTPDVRDALDTALRWTRGLPMRRRTGFAFMREGVERLGLLAPVVLPLVVAHALRDAEPADAAQDVQATPRLERSDWIDGVLAQASQGWIGHVVQLRGIDFGDAFQAGLSPEHAVQAARDWICGSVAFGPRPFAWGQADGAGRPFQRDAHGRLRSIRPDGDTPPTETGDSRRGSGAHAQMRAVAVGA